MTIKRVSGDDTSDEMPAAKLYLDDIREIVEILTHDSEPGPVATAVRFQVGNLQCDTLEELEQLGGHRRRFEIRVQAGNGTSTVSFRRYITYLWLSVPEAAYWSKQGKIERIFERNAILWKNIANKCLHSLPFLLTLPLVVTTLDILAHRFLPAAFKTVQHEIYYGFWVCWVLFVTVYQFGFAGSVAILHYSHQKSWRNWFQDHGSQLLLVILGVVLKFLGDLIWHHFSH